MEQEHSGYRSKEEEMAAKEFEAPQLDSGILPQENEMGKMVLEQLGNFRRTKTEQFAETNQNLQEFSKEISEKFSSEDQREIFDALTLMDTLHIYQKDRPEGSPYVSHPLFVARKVVSMSQSPDKDLVIAALMHDAVEDQADKLSSLHEQKTEGLNDEQRALLELQRRYGDRVKDIVSHLSNPDFDSILAERGVTKDNPQYQELKNKLYADHVAEAIQDPDILIVKLADFSENALSLDKLPEETEDQKSTKQKYIKKYGPVMKIFIDKLARENRFPNIRLQLEQQYSQLGT